MKKHQPAPPSTGISRREVLSGIGLGLGTGLVSSACSLGPRVCGADRPGVPDPAARDAEARALLSHIDTFVVVMLENRSFDHLLGGLKMDRGYPGAPRLAGLRGDESNLDGEGRVVRVARMPGDGRGSMNPEHGWRAVRATFNGGRNDGFVRVNAGPHQAEVMSYLTRDQLPFFHSLADRYTVFDQWHASYMGQTWPNRAFLHATTSGGKFENKPFGWDAPIGIWERMAERCLSARNYAAGPILWYAAAFPVHLFSGDSAMVPGKIEDFFRDARAGNLPNFALIDPDFKVNDAYPMHSPAPCEAFIASIIKAVAEGPQWSRSLIVITFDEHGGYYDHVVPGQTVDLRPEFRQLGFRVPAIAVGPTVRRGAVVSTPLEHVSVAATLRARWGIETLSARMDATADISACIDPALIDAPAAPPRDLEPVALDSRVFASLLGARTSQPEVEAALAAHRLPDGIVDARSDEERFGSWLRHAQELAAVKVRR